MTKHAAASFHFALSLFLPYPGVAALCKHPVPLGTSATEKKIEKLIPEDYIVQKCVSCMTSATGFQEIIP